MNYVSLKKVLNRIRQHNDIFINYNAITQRKTSHKYDVYFRDKESQDGIPTVIRQWSAVLNQWQRLKSMDNNRINYKIFEWGEQNAGQRCITWNFRINRLLRDAGAIT